MESGLLNLMISDFHDESRLPSSYYGEPDSYIPRDELFEDLIVPEVVDNDRQWLDQWPLVDIGGPSEENAPNQSDTPNPQKDEFQRLLCEWQHSLNNMQKSEILQEILPSKVGSEEVSAIFTSLQSSPNVTPTLKLAIDELFLGESIAKGIQSNLSQSEIITEDDPSLSEEKEEVENTLIPPTLLCQNDIPRIKIKDENEDIPLLLPGDLTSLLEQFEATVRGDTQLLQSEAPILTSSLPSVDTLQEELPTSLVKIEPKESIDCKQSANVAEAPISSCPQQVAVPYNSFKLEITEPVVHDQQSENVAAVLHCPHPSTQSIRDALPEEVINRIKASRETHKKIVAVIPALPNKKHLKAATRMQDAGVALSRNKMLKLVTDLVHLDHDYCSTSSGPGSSSSGSTPEHQPNAADQFLGVADTGSRKDSGLESGDVSEEDNKSVSAVSSYTRKNTKKQILVHTSTGIRSINIGQPNAGIVVCKGSVARTNQQNLSLLKKNCVKLENNELQNFNLAEPNRNKTITCNSKVPQSQLPTIPNQYTESVIEDINQKKKRKLNLDEYRMRRIELEKVRSQDSSGTSTPVSCSTSNGSLYSTTSSGDNIDQLTRPLMHSVEVQTQQCEIIDLTASKSPLSSTDVQRRDNRLESSKKSYLHHRSKTSSSSRSWEPKHHRRKRRSRSNKRRRNSTSRMWSRSRSRSSSGSWRHNSSRSRSRSRSRSKPRSHESRRKRRSSSHSRNSSHNSRRDRHTRDWSWNRSRSPVRKNTEFGVPEKVRQVEERRVIYVGRIEEGTTKAELRRRFQKFGPIVDISVHFRERGDNYGFVTFAYKSDAYQAVEHGNDDRMQPHYDLCFGGRRAFCKQQYADLDGMASSIQHQYYPPQPQQRHDESFDSLLHDFKAQLRKRPV